MTEIDLCYQLMYVEPSGRPPGRDPWSIRQTGVYHRWDASVDVNLFILLHPRHSPPVQEKLENLAHKPDERDALVEHPLNVHIVLLTSCLSFWQAYIQDLAKKLSDYVSNFLCNKTMFIIYVLIYAEVTYACA